MTQEEKEFASEWIERSIDIEEDLIYDVATLENICTAADAIFKSFINGGKLLSCGNGGSASDAEHMTAELLNRFNQDQRDTPLPAINLSAHNSTITAIANDYDYVDVFSKQVLAFGATGDVLMGITTSGNSENVRKAIEAAGELGLITILLTGDVQPEREVADINICMPCSDTPFVQELHIKVIHILCGLIDRKWVEHQDKMDAETILDDEDYKNAVRELRENARSEEQEGEDE
jgi:D-sedoheptulose 7-phosphate isomerase